MSSDFQYICIITVYNSCTFIIKSETSSLEEKFYLSNDKMLKLFKSKYIAKVRYKSKITYVLLGRQTIPHGHRPRHI